MKENIARLMFGMLTLILPLSSHAQLGNLLNNIVNQATKAINESQNTGSDAQNNSTPAGKSNQTAQRSPDDKSSQTQPQGNLNQTFSVDAFKKAWCTNIDKSVSSPFDYKGVVTGDLCLAPDDLILAIHKRSIEAKEPAEWMTNASLHSDSKVYTYPKVIAGDKKFSKLVILTDSNAKKAYLGSINGLICAADASNSLSEGNSFRTALDAKYGKPSEVVSEYDVLKAQIDDLENRNKSASQNAITVREAKNARDVNAQLPLLKSALAATDKKAITTIIWDFDKSRPIRPYGYGAITRMENTLIRELGGCPIRDQQDIMLGFVFELVASKGLQGVESRVVKQNNTNYENKVKNAPAPKL